MHQILQSVPWLLMILGMWALGIWLLLLSPRNLGARAFALFLLVRGVANVELVLFWDSDKIIEAQYWVAALAGIAAIPIACAFILVFPRPRFPWAARTWPWLAMTGATFALLAFIAAVPTSYVDYDRSSATPVGAPGPLGVLGPLAQLTLAAAGLVFARDYLRQAPGPARRAVLLVSVGFGLFAAFLAGRVLAALLGGRFFGAPSSSTNAVGFGVASLAGSIVYHLMAVVVVLQIITLQRGVRRQGPSEQRPLRAASALLLVAAATGVLRGFWNPQFGSGLDLHTFLSAGWRLGLVALAFYGQLRLRLFDVDLKLKRTIRQGAMAVALLVVFFVATQLAQNFFSAKYGWAWGGAAAGLMLFAVSPLYRIADRVANAALPNVKDTPEWRQVQQDDAFRFAVRMALADRFITREEERGLAHLAVQLGLDQVQALDLREQVERELGLLPSPKKPKASRPSRAT